MIRFWFAAVSIYFMAIAGCNGDSKPVAELEPTPVAKVQKVAKADQGSEKESETNHATLVPDEGWGTLTGQIVLEGEAPELKREEVGAHIDKPFCLVDGEVPFDNNIVVNPKGKGLRDVLVMMYLKKSYDPIEAHPSYDETRKEPAILDNVRCRFTPKVVIVRPGQKLILRNSDPVGHNCHIVSFNNEHNLNLPANGELELVLQNNDKFPGKISCDLHQWMDSVILVRENPYVVSTDTSGKFVIENIPPGDWKFQFWHKEVGYLKKLKVADGRKVGRRGEIDAKIENSEINDLGQMKIAAEALIRK